MGSGYFGRDLPGWSLPGRPDPNRRFTRKDTKSEMEAGPGQPPRGLLGDLEIFGANTLTPCAFWLRGFT